MNGTNLYTNNPKGSVCTTTLITTIKVLSDEVAKKKEKKENEQKFA